MSVYWFEKEDLTPAVVLNLEKVEIVLDIGCGIVPQRFIRPLVHICCEPYGQYIEHLQDKTTDAYDRNYVIVKANWAEAVKIFPEKSVDTVFLVDVIEHIEKDEALELLKVTENIARRQIAIFTPLGFMPQHHDDGKDAWGLDGGVWQEHKSGWMPEDFDESWEIYASKDFHTTDNMGNILDNPYGALWAIKTMNVLESENSEVSLRKEKQRAILEIAIDAKDTSFLKKFHSIAFLMTEIKHCGAFDRIIRVMEMLLKIQKSKLNSYRHILFRKLGLIE